MQQEALRSNELESICNVFEAEIKKLKKENGYYIVQYQEATELIHLEKEKNKMKEV